MRMGLIHWMLLVAAVALPLHAVGVAWREGTGEAWGVAMVCLLLGCVGVGSIVASLSTSRRFERAIGATWGVLIFMAVGVAAPTALSLVLLPIGVVAGGFLWLWLAGYIRT